MPCKPMPLPSENPGADLSKFPVLSAADEPLLDASGEMEGVGSAEAYEMLM
ncbi:hypothetical protein FALCPG4_015344 [Fusarium falciforme]